MKKFILFVAVFVFGLANVSAMTESELKAKLTDTYTVNGATFKATDQEKTLIERYLDQYDVSSADADLIVQKLEEVFDILRASGKTKFQDLSSSDKNRIVNIVANVSAQTSVDCAIVDGELVVYVPGTSNGTVFYESPVTPIAQTNRDLLVAGLGFISVVGLALAFKKVKNA